MNRLARKIGIAIVYVAIATSQCIVFAYDTKEDTVITEADKAIEYEISIDRTITDVKPSDTKTIDANITDASTNIATGSAIVIKLDTSSLVEDISEISDEILEGSPNEEGLSEINIDERKDVEKTEVGNAELENIELNNSEVENIIEQIEETVEAEVTLIEETKNEADPTEEESTIVNTLADESIVESHSSEIIVDNSAIDNTAVESNTNEVTTGASTMISIEESVEKATGAACEIEVVNVTQDPLQVEPIQYVERVEKIEIENLSDILNVNMSYTTVDYKRLDIKVNYEVILDIEADQIEIEDSFFGKTILNKADGVYTGEASKVVGFEDVMQSLIVKGFYNAKVLEAVTPDKIESIIPDQIESITPDQIESVIPEDNETADDSLGI